MLALAVSVCAIRRPLYVGICLWVLLPSLAGEAFAGAGGSAPRAGGPRRDDRALVTYVGGDVVVLAAKARGGRVEIGDELRSGTRLELGKSSQVTVLWTRGRSTTIRGPRCPCRGLVRPPSA